MSHLEVERKFRPTGILKGYLERADLGANKSHMSCAKSISSIQASVKGPELLRMPDKEIRDTYYDDNDQLSNKGIWIRQRETRSARLSPDLGSVQYLPSVMWEAKDRIDGTHMNTQAMEIQGREAVKRLLGRRAPEVSLRYLEVMADLHKFRRSWLMRECSAVEGTKQLLGGVQQVEMRLDLDIVTAPSYITRQPEESFRQEVGEVEMTRAMIDDGAANGAQQRTAVTALMHLEVERFFEKYESLFSIESAQGRLSAFFAWKDKSGGQLVAEAVVRPHLADD